MFKIKASIALSFSCVAIAGLLVASPVLAETSLVTNCDSSEGQSGDTFTVYQSRNLDSLFANLQSWFNIFTTNGGSGKGTSPEGATPSTDGGKGTSPEGATPSTNGTKGSSTEGASRS